jgi:hypothetical protein
MLEHDEHFGFKCLFFGPKLLVAQKAYHAEYWMPSGATTRQSAQCSILPALTRAHETFVLRHSRCALRPWRRLATPEAIS